jgi:hypothetical protein
MSDVSSYVDPYLWFSSKQDPIPIGVCCFDGKPYSIIAFIAAEHPYYLLFDNKTKENFKVFCEDVDYNDLNDNNDNNDNKQSKKENKKIVIRLRKDF